MASISAASPIVAWEVWGEREKERESDGKESISQGICAVVDISTKTQFKVIYTKH